jgi:hypothetical protein
MFRPKHTLLLLFPATAPGFSMFGKELPEASPNIYNATRNEPWLTPMESMPLGNWEVPMGPAQRSEIGRHRTLTLHLS